MVMGSRSSIIAAAILLVAACGSPTSSGPASSGQSAPAASSSSATGATTPSPSNGPPPMVPGPAWAAVLDQVGADGTVSRDVALQAFALAFGSLPGVTTPPGDSGSIPSGSMALRWLVSYWAELTPEQQAAAIVAIPELAGIQRTSSTPGDAVLAVARPDPPSAVAPALAQQRSNAWYTQLAKEMIGQIALRLPNAPDIGLQVDAHFGLAQGAKSGMETGVYDANGGIGGKPAKCVIVVSPLGDAQTDSDVQVEMAHEAWHCYEGAIVGLARLWSQNPAPWIIEGEAAWVGASIVPTAPLAEQAWWDYLDKPELSMFSRTYSGIGFFAHLGDIALDPWTKLVPVLEAKSNTDAFTAAGADADAFLDSWASSYLADPGRGMPWNMTGPAIPQDKAQPVAISLPNGASITESAKAYGNVIAVLTDTPEVLETTFSGRARLSDGSGHDYLAGDSGAFCLLKTGCVCPAASGEPPPLPLDASGVALGVTGGAKGSTGTLVGMKLVDYCNKGITGTWDGTWQNDAQWGGTTGGFTLTVVQKGTAVTGTTDVTGPTCIRHGTVTGTVVKDHVSMGWVAAGIRDVAYEGTLTGNAMSGTWTAIACGLDQQITGTWSATRRQ
jgi:hypothetical protein